MDGVLDQQERVFDTRQRVVDLVGDACGHAPRCGELLVLDLLPFQLLDARHARLNQFLQFFVVATDLLLHVFALGDVAE